MMKELEFSRAAPVLFTETTDSTNLQLKKLAAEGAVEGSVLVALRQSAGRGRMGRGFISPEGGVYLSMLLRPEMNAEKLPQLSACAAVAARRAIYRCCGVQTDIKWPNDLLFDGKKLCGILAESSFCGEEGFVILGLGINLNTPQECFPEELRGLAGSVYSLTGRETDRAAFSRELIRELDRVYAAWRAGEELLGEYRSACINPGREVRLLQNGACREAVALDIAEDMSLLVRLPDGSEEKIRFGEVSVRDLY